MLCTAPARRAQTAGRDLLTQLGRITMKKVLLAAVAACFSLAIAGAQAATTSEPSSVPDTGPSGKAPSTDAKAKTRAPKENKRKTPDPSSVEDAGPTGKAPSTDAKAKTRAPKENKRTTPEPSSVPDAGPVPQPAGKTKAEKK